MSDFKHWIAGVACAVAVTASAFAADGSYPDKKITIIVATTPGAANDILARVVGKGLTERLKQPVIVEDRPGASGLIGTNQFVKSEPDGYTMLVQSTTLIAAQAFAKNPSFDVDRDMAPVAMLASAPLGIFVNAEMPVNTVGEFIDYVKKNPGKVNYGSTGAGTIMHITTERFNYENGGLKMVHVPYAGAVPVVAALMSNNIQVIIIDIASGYAGIRAGKLKLLAVGGTERLAILPNVPTTAEAGLPFNPSVWYGLFTRAGTPPAALRTLYDAVSQIIAEPSYRHDIEATGAQMPTASPQQFKTIVSSDLAKLKEVVVKAKIEQE